MNTQEFIRHCEACRPQLRIESDFEKMATLLGTFDVLNQIGGDKRVLKETFCDACAELIPEQREFWLRVEATIKERFINGFTALMRGPDDDDDARRIVEAQG